MPLVEVQVTCIRRYAKELCDIPIYLATEMPLNTPCIQRILKHRKIYIVALDPNESDFLESRIAATKYLSEQYDIILPLQEDFWLDRRPDMVDLNDAILIFESDKKVNSIRLMPCPGPIESDIRYNGSGRWKIISDDIYKFTFQATMWRSSVYLKFLEEVIKKAKIEYKNLKIPNSEWSKYCVNINVAENTSGQKIFKDTCMGSESIHLSIEREHKEPNAVFLCPWPYRPTAVVKGVLEPWAKEFAIREGFAHLENWY